MARCALKWLISAPHMTGLKRRLGRTLAFWSTVALRHDRWPRLSCEIRTGTSFCAAGVLPRTSPLVPPQATFALSVW
jgi:hypothetical protein